MKIYSLFIALILSLPVSLQAKSITSAPFGKTDDGKATLYTLTNDNDMVVKITDFGGIITEIHVPDRNGKMGDVVLGHDKVEDYADGHPYFGAIAGRYANRIALGQFSIDGNDYQLETNNGVNALHGGLKGFDKVIWKTKELKGKDYVGIKLSYLSKDGEEGYPGNLDTSVIYKLSNDNSIEIEYEATTDKPTVVNLTHHSYFNLAGHNGGNILSHDMMINASHYTPVDETLIPTGEIIAVKDTPFDFTRPKPIGARIEQDHEQLAFGGGIDHNFVLDKNKGEWTLAARVSEPRSGRAMEVWTTEPAIQLYVGNFLDATDVGKGGVTYYYRNGFCLETQHFPDSPNQPHFPSTRLDPGETYSTKTTYKFSAY